MRFLPQFYTLILLLPLGACDDDTTGPEEVAGTDATTSVEVDVSGGATPTFSWSPDCEAALLLVEGDFEGDTWHITTDEATWDDAAQANRIRSSVTYGTVPAGVDERYGPLTLVEGRQYQVLLWRISPDGDNAGCTATYQDACMIGRASFTR